MALSDKILLVTVDGSVRRTRAAVLIREGYSVWVADSVATARDLLSRFHYDLVLLDHSLHQAVETFNGEISPRTKVNVLPQSLSPEDLLVNIQQMLGSVEASKDGAGQA